MLVAPAGAGDEPTGPTWPEDSRLSATRLNDTYFLFWPAAADDGGVVEYRILLHDRERTRVGAATRMAMISSNATPGDFAVIAVDGAGYESAELSVTGSVEPHSEELPRLSIRVLEQIGVDGGLPDSGARSDQGPSPSTLPLPTIPPASVPATTAPPSTVPPSTVLPTTMPAPPMPPPTTVPSTSVPDTGGEGQPTCGPDIVVEGLGDLSRTIQEIGPVQVFIPEGRYRVTAISRDDGHAPGVQENQLDERWSARSSTGWSLPTTPDLSTADTEARFDLGETTVSDTIHQLWFRWEGRIASANSIEPALQLSCVRPSVDPPAEADSDEAPVTIGEIASDTDEDGIVDAIDRWPYLSDFLDSTTVFSSAFVIGDSSTGRLMTRDRGDLWVRPTVDGEAITLKQRRGDQLVDVVLCSQGLLGGHPVTLLGDMGATVSCDPFRLDVVSGVASVRLPDGSRVDLPARTSLVGVREVSSWRWWSMGDGVAVLRGVDGQDAIFDATSDSPHVVEVAPR